MSVTYVTATKTARLDATRLDVVSGTLEIGTAGMAAVLATFDLTATAGTVTDDTWTLEFDLSTVTATGAGVAAAARIRDSVSGDVITGPTVATSAADINLDNVNINTGQEITLNSASIQHAA